MTPMLNLRTRMTLVTLAFLAMPVGFSATSPVGLSATQTADLPSIAEKTEGMESIDGFLPLYWDEDRGQLWMEIPELDLEMIHFSGFGAGLGSNDLGLDRGALRGGTQIVKFERVGRRVMMVQPNYRFRALTDNPAEARAVTDAFARSILWGFTAEAETDGRVLVDLTGFLVRDAVNAGQSMRPGTYRLDQSRSSIYMEMTDAFPTNTELEVELTFTRQPGGGGGGGGGALEGVGSVAASGEAATIRLHHSFVALPDDGYETRAYDPRAGFGSVTFQDYAAPLGAPMTQRFIRRHRLEKRTPSARVSEAVEPIIYYLDPGAPEPMRSALLDGARWWNQAFEAAGYRDAFQVMIRPDSISSLDARYNVINWVHRSTRGWSTGGSVTDPRTGEIIKGVVTLGSLRVRQDYLMAEGLLSPYTEGDETPPELAEWSLARIRQLAAHEVGHTIGLGHNYYNSGNGRISVMDYPHPLIALNEDGSLDFSEVYDVDIGDWDKVAITYGYREFPSGDDEDAQLASILRVAWGDDIRYMTGQDASISPQADLWANGTDMGHELNRMMDVRASALERFGVQAIQSDMPMATIEEALVPLYMHHRYQVEATASAIGGVEYTYAVRGDGLQPFRRVSADMQRGALDALMRTLVPAELTLPESVLNVIPPRPPGFGRHRELFPRYTGSAFDAVTPAVVAAGHTVAMLLEPTRAARLVQQHTFDPSLPGLEEVLEGLFEASMGASVNTEYQAEVKRAVEGVVLARVMWLARNASMPQVRAISSASLRRSHSELLSRGQSEAHAQMLAGDIQRFLDRPGEVVTDRVAPSAPPGSPIGEPALDWLGQMEPWCSWLGDGWDGF
ncbi:MAG: zinc-dependent metalloprotease [Gemmatimonadetes bacterium]|nr:zinc-dependent metalloprotease [Gemmatimonadota bacterium]